MITGQRTEKDFGQKMFLSFAVSISRVPIRVRQFGFDEKYPFEKCRRCHKLVKGEFWKHFEKTVSQKCMKNFAKLKSTISFKKHNVK